MYSVFENNHNGTNGSIEELAPLLKKYGIGGIGVPREVLDDKVRGREVGKIVYDNGLKWGVMPTPKDFYQEGVDDEQFDDGIETLKRWADVGEKMGVKFCYNHIWNGSNTREYEENFDWVVTRARQIWKVLHDHGIRYGLEFLGPHPLRNSFKYPFFNKITGVLAIADSVDPSMGFLFDTFHWYCGTNGDMADLFYASKHVDRMVGFHINDGVAGKSYTEQEDLERGMPLQNGVIRAEIPYRMIKEAGFDGPVLAEAMHLWSDRQKGRALEDVVRDVAAIYANIDKVAAEK